MAFDLPGLPVDTHVGRLSRRLKLTNETDPVKAELDLNALVPPEERGRFSLRLILHGRQVCFARKPELLGLRPRRHLPLRRPQRAPQAETNLRQRAVALRRVLTQVRCLGELLEGVVGAFEGAAGGEEVALGEVEVVADGRVGGLAVAVAEGDDARGEIGELGLRLESSARSDEGIGPRYRPQYRRPRTGSRLP